MTDIELEAMGFRCRYNDMCRADALVAEALMSALKSVRAIESYRLALNPVLLREVEKLEIAETEPATLAAMILGQLLHEPA